jgi:hypothetical protein
MTPVTVPTAHPKAPACALVGGCDDAARQRAVALLAHPDARVLAGSHGAWLVVAGAEVALVDPTGTVTAVVDDRCRLWLVDRLRVFAPATPAAGTGTRQGRARPARRRTRRPHPRGGSR